MNHPLPIRREQHDGRATPDAASSGLPQPPLDDDMGAAVQWLYEQWLAKDVAAPPAQR